MDPLDLRTGAPRAPREQLADVIFLPRTIDKARASLPGGHLGEYAMAGFSTMMLEMLGVDLNDFIFLVGGAQSDEDVAEYVRANAAPERIQAWNDMISQRKPRGGNREEALGAYPWLAEYDELPLALDVLAEDDRRLFESRT